MDWNSHFIVVCSMWRLDRHIRLLLLHIPLSREIRHVGLHATIILLWLHDLHLLWILPYSGDCQFPCAFAVRWMRISGPQIDISRQIGWLDPSSTHRQESNSIGQQGYKTKHSS